MDDKSTRTVVIIQARMGSTRLPGKVLMEVAGRPLLSWQLQRVGAAERVDDVVVAIPDREEDRALEALCCREGVACFRGSENDVLARFYGAAKEACADVIVRLTGDCPLIDPVVLDRVVGEFLRGYPEVAYVSNVMERRYPRGLDVEVFSRKALEAAFVEATEPGEREHVTPFLYCNPARFPSASVIHTVDCSDHRWTVDTAEDFALVKNIMEHFLPERPLFSWEEALELVAEHPEWQTLNSHVEQKNV